MNVYEVITNRIIESLDKGVVPWRQSWTTSTPKNFITKKAYRGINVFLLNASRYTSSYWLTYKQAASKGGFVRKNERSTPIVFWKIYDNETRKDGKPKKTFVLRYYPVFNLTQTEGIEIPAEEKSVAFNPIEACQRIVSGYQAKGPPIVHGGNRACYSPSADEITIPAQSSFESPESYYCTLFHEMIHSTGAKSRLDRDGVTNPIKYGSHAYSYEELIAECGASFLCGEANVLDATIDNSVSYLKHWTSRLKSDPTWIVRASGEAAKAADYVLGKSREEKEESEETT